MIDDVPVIEVEIRSERRRARKDPHLWRRGARPCYSEFNGLQRVVLAEHARGLSRPFAEVRRGAGPVRQPHRQRPVRARWAPINSILSPARNTRSMAAPEDLASGSGSSGVDNPTVHSSSNRRTAIWLPRRLTATCIYRFVEPATLRVELGRPRTADHHQPDSATAISISTAPPIFLIMS